MAFDPFIDKRLMEHALREQKLRYEHEIEYMRRTMYGQNPQLQSYQNLPGNLVPVGEAPAPPVKRFGKNTLDALKKAEPRKVGQRVPDSVEVITAWRAWRTVNVNGEWQLKALGVDKPWEPKKMVTAVCTSDPNKHPAPCQSCECGVWGFGELDVLMQALDSYSAQTVIGQVSMWGRVIECANGFRSQFAYPKELWLADKGMEQLGYSYGVPIRTID